MSLTTVGLGDIVPADEHLRELQYNYSVILDMVIYRVCDCICAGDKDEWVLHESE